MALLPCFRALLSVVTPSAASTIAVARLLPPLLLPSVARDGNSNCANPECEEIGLNLFIRLKLVILLAHMVACVLSRCIGL